MKQNYQGLPQKMQPMRVGMAGVGGYGAYRRQLMRESGLFQLVAVCDVNRLRLEQCVQEESTQAVSSFGELLEYPGLEGLFISTPAHFHAEQVVSAMMRGIPVFVEKPLCSTMAELKWIMNAADETNIPLVCGHVYHETDPISCEMKRLINDGVLGRLASFQRTSAHSGGLKLKDTDWRSDPERNLGGMLFHCGVHGFYEIEHQLGRVAQISAFFDNTVHTTATADTAVCLLRLESGLVGSLAAYHVTPYRHTFNIFGTEANLYRDERYGEEGTILTIQRRDPSGGYEPREPLESWKSLSDPQGSLSHFYQACRNNAPYREKLLAAARAVALVFAAARSAELGTNISLPHFCPFLYPSAQLFEDRDKDSSNLAVESTQFVTAF